MAVIALALSLASTATAQFTVVSNQGYPPVVVNNIGGDPYATVGPPQPAGWLGAWPGVPTMNSITDRLWLRAEYLHWWTEGMDLPPLVTTSPTGTAQDQAAILGEPGTSILFGGREINGSSVGGIRLKAGFWLSPQGAFGIESEYFGLRDQNDGFNAGSDGTTILGRPFFDIANGQETALLISYPNEFSGNIAIGSKTELSSFLLNGRAALSPIDGVAWEGQPDRVDLIVGYRYLDLSDRLTFAQNLNAPPDTAVFSESFQTKNKFNGLQLGVAYQANFRRAWLESLIRVAVGNNQQSVNIFGSTAITQAGTTENFSGGLLAQPTNIGNYRRKQFTMIPELGLTLGIRVKDWLHATVGYSVLYYPSVVRAGDQIDTDVNPDFTGAPRPRFRFVESDYWAQGINLGAEFRF
jgi:hypothetical protein